MKTFKKRIRVGEIVKIYDEDNEFKFGRVLNVDYKNELAMIVYLDDLFKDLETVTVSILNLEKYEGKIESK